MLWRSHPSPPHGIVVEVIQLLQHHLIAEDRLRMKTFLPHLMRARPFMTRTKVFKLVAQPGAPFPRKWFENPAHRELLSSRR